MSRERRKWTELRRFHFPVTVGVSVFNYVGVHDGAEVEKFGAGGGSVPEVARFDGGISIAAEGAECGVGSENFAGGGWGSVPAAAVVEEDGDGDGECSGDNGGDGDGEEFTV